MEKLLTFVDADGDNLFSAPAEVLPRAGDVVNFSHEARDGEKWNTEAWEESMDMSGKEWTVQRVCHDFRRMSIDRTAHVVFVVLTPNAPDQKRAEAYTSKRQRRLPSSASGCWKAKGVYISPGEADSSVKSSHPD